MISLPPRTPGEPLEFPLEAGTYSFAVFEPRLTFTVDDGWVAYRDYRDAAGIFLTEGPQPQEPPSQSVGGIDFARVQVVFKGPCIDDGTELIESEPAAFMTWLRAHPGLQVRDVLPVNLGGYSGLAIEISVRADTCPTDGPANWLFPVGEDVFRIFPAERARLTTLDVAGRPLSVIISGAGGEDFFQIADEVLTTLKVDP